MPRVLTGLTALALLVSIAGIETAAVPAESSYVGSQACQRCHQSSYDSWRQTLHVQMTKPIAEARVEGDFGTHAAQGRGPLPASLSQDGRTYSFERRDGRYFVTIGKGANRARPPETFEVHYTLGARRFQGYLSKLPDGRIYVLPVFWHNESKRWVDWKEITPIPDDPDHDLRQIWNVTCVNCHATNLVKNFDPAANRYATTWTEMGIGCEACHGPGAAHVTVTGHWEKNPAAKPEDPTPSDLKIFSPLRATPRQVFDTCGYCHGNKNNVFFGFKPGDRYEDYALPFLISQPIPDNDPQGDFWPDGRPSRFNRPQALTLTGCFRKGEATCTSCHRMHGSQNSHSLKVQVEAPDRSLTRESDQLCTQCHKGERLRPVEKNPSGETIRAAASPDTWSTHTHHAPDSQGSRCIGCHMSEVNWRLITRRRDHTFQPPVPEMMSRFGAPAACITCHEDKAPEWAARTMDAWYGNGERRRAVVAAGEMLYRAGAGDVSVLPEVVRLALDRSRGSLVRASAAEFSGQLIAKSARERLRPRFDAASEGRGDASASVRAAGEAPRGGAPAPVKEDRPVAPASPAAVITPTIINALIGAAADPEAMVRITAVRSLALISDARVPPVLASHLTDEARLVRVAAAEALTMLGVVQLAGPAGAALVRALDEWAESLRTFNDVAADQTTLGWLEASRGHRAEAEQHLRTGIALDPSDARPHVYLGVIAARDGRFDEAVRHFKNAKALSPGYQNLDRLLDEASRRATKGH